MGLVNNSIHGVRPATMKKIAVFFFGSQFYACQKNIRIDSVEILVKRDTEQWQMDAFEKFWKVPVLKIEKQ